MKFLIIKKYTILSKILKFSFVGIFSFALILSSFSVNNYTKTAKADNPLVKITNFNPTSGKVGDTITITGENFINVTKVLLNTTTAIIDTNNPSSITISVPPGAKTGMITIKTALNGQATTTNSFNVLTTGGVVNPPESEEVNQQSVYEYNDVKFKGLVPVCNTVVDATNGGFKDPCDFNMVMALVNKFINFLLITLATPLFALIIIYTGWLYLSDMGSVENVKKAKKIFKNAFIGYVIALAAWLIVKTILVSVGFDPKQAFLEV